MHPNRPFNSLYQEWKESDPTNPLPNVVPVASYNCLTLHWENGEEMTFYYPFLLSVKLYLPAEHNLLVLHFTAEKVTLKGYGLKPLKRLFAREKPSDIFVSNPRYVSSQPVTQPVIIEAVVEERRP
jgi:hypothetical protein